MPEHDRGRPTFGWRAWLGIGLGSLVIVSTLPILTAPGVEPSCEHLFELASGAGEPPDQRTRELCWARLAERKERRGTLGWAWTSWCMRLAESVPEAGECSRALVSPR